MTSDYFSGYRWELITIIGNGTGNGVGARCIEIEDDKTYWNYIGWLRCKMEQPYIRYGVYNCGIDEKYPLFDIIEPELNIERLHG